MREVQLHTRKSELQGLVALVDNEDYEKVTGVDDLGKPLRWNINWGGRTFYAYARSATVDGHHGVFMHRLLLNILNDLSKECDHKDHNGLDNQKSNLRTCTRSQNMQNGRSWRGTSEYRGVIWYEPAQKWTAQIGRDGKQQYLGIFVSEVEAACAYDAAAILYHDPEFRTLNFPSLAG